MTHQLESQPVDSQDLNPSKQTVRGLNALLFFLSDVRNGVGPLLSIYLRSTLSWDAAKIGLALATVEISSFLSQIPAGLLADASRYKRLIIAIACCLIISGCLAILSYPYFSTIILAQIIMGISIALISPTLGAITLGLFGRKKLPARASKNEMWNHTGNVSTALLAGLAGYFLGSHWIFYLVIACGLSSMFALTFIRPQEINHEVARELAEIDPLTHAKAAEPLPLSRVLKRPSILIFNASLILYYIANGAQMGLVSQVLANKSPAHSALLIAACMVIAEFSMIVIAYVMSRIVNRFSRKFFFLTAFCILPIRAFLYTVVDNPFLLLSIQILDGAAAGILGVMGTVINSDLAIGTGRFNFLQGMGALSTSVGESISHISAGLIARSFGFNAGFLTLASVAILGSLFFGLFMPETKKMAVTEA